MGKIRVVVIFLGMGGTVVTVVKLVGILLYVGYIRIYTDI